MPSIDRRFRGNAPSLAAWMLVIVAALACVAGNASAASVGLDAGADLEAMQRQASAATEGLTTEGLTAQLGGVGLDPVALPSESIELSSVATQGPAPTAPPQAALALDRPEVQAAAGAGAVATMALALGARPLWLLGAFAPLYSRLDRGELLNHPTRRELMRIIAQDPGVNISDLHGRFDLGWGSLLYHLQRLEAQGLVVSHRWGRSRRYFVNQRGVESRAEGIRALKAQNARALAETVTAQPGRTQEELAVALGLSKSVVSKYAKRLADASLVQREVGRNCLRLFPTAELRELLHTAAQPGHDLPAPTVASIAPSPDTASGRHDDEGPQAAAAAL